MAKKKQPANLVTFIVLIAIVAVAGFCAFNFYNGLAPAADNFGSPLSGFKTVDINAINLARGLKACGNWPISGIYAGTQRGNPFAKKSAGTPVMTAVSAPQCLPIAQ